MARELVFELEGEVSHLPLARVDRSKLYGRRRRVVTDEDGQTCQSAWLSADGQTLVPAGGYALAYVDEAGNTVERGELQSVDADGEVLDKLPSTLGVSLELYGPVPLTRVLDHVTRSVYQLDDEKIGAQLAEALAAGHIYETEFRYSASVRTDTLFLLRNEHGTFGLICEAVDLSFVQRSTPEPPDAFDDEEDEELDDDLDFSF